MTVSEESQDNFIVSYLLTLKKQSLCLLLSVFMKVFLLESRNVTNERHAFYVHSRDCDNCDNMSSERLMTICDVTLTDSVVNAVTICYPGAFITFFRIFKLLFCYEILTCCVCPLIFEYQ